MKIILATGIYPPDIGGPATYVRNLGRKLTEHGLDVTVVTFGKPVEEDDNVPFEVVRVANLGGPLGRWNAFARALKKHGTDADIVYCFSSVSVGIPLWLARLKKPKKILRLGGDFVWERYTDIGGRRTLRGFYVLYPGMKNLTKRILKIFDHVVFSTAYQERLYEFLMRRMPSHSVIENALPEDAHPVVHAKHEPFRLLFLGRFVRFKNLLTLLKAVSLIPFAHLTLVGEGPMKKQLLATIGKMGLRARVVVEDAKHGVDKAQLFMEHDMLVIPSVTEISPHAAIEARSAGLPVLLTEETGLTGVLADGMLIRKLRTSQDITRGIIEAEQNYDVVAAAAGAPFTHKRTWDDLTSETLALIESLLEETSLTGAIDNE